MAMLHTTDIDMAGKSDMADFLTNTACTVWSTYHTVLKSSPGAAIFGRDMFFDVPFLAEWSRKGQYRQKQADSNTDRESSAHVDWDN
jgi:hypothetical protein